MKIKAKAAKQALKLAELLYPQGTRVNDVWCIGDKFGNPGSALDINLIGPRAGYARDFKTGDTLDIFDLWQAVYVVDFAEARRQLKAWLGGGNLFPAPRR